MIFVGALVIADCRASGSPESTAAIQAEPVTAVAVDCGLFAPLGNRNDG
jgi:hypothetical protein